MSIEVEKTTAEQKQANQDMRKIATIVNTTIGNLREVAPNGQHLQQLENRLISYADLLCFDIATQCLGNDILPRLKKETLNGKAVITEMNAEEEEKDRHYFFPEDHFFISSDSKLAETIRENNRGETLTPLEIIHHHLQSVLDTLVTEYPQIVDNNKMVYHHVLEAWGEIIEATKPDYISPQFWWEKNPPAPIVDDELLSEALGAMSDE